jgi:hypothetical protein
MKLIITVFGVAALLVLVWAVLWILGTRKKD